MKRFAFGTCMTVLAVVLCLSVVGLGFVPDAYAAGATESSSFKPLTIIGKDDRVRVKDTSQYPYSAIAYMVVEGKCGHTWTGSGFMVLPDVLMTAGHCIYCTECQEPADKIDFYFGYQENDDYLYRYSGRWESYYGTTFPGGYTSENMKWDYGLVKFDENVGNKTGWFGMHVRSDSEFNNATLRVAGYREGMLKYDNGKTTVGNDQLIKFYADTQPGNSGCPLYDGEIASAICIAENADGEYNVGRRITEDMFNKAFSMTSTNQKPDAPAPKENARVVNPNNTGKDGYILPDSATYQYSREELSVLDDWGLCLARNEIPARHGYIFESGNVSNYFSGKSWYRGTLTGDEYRKIVGIQNYVEEANVQTILALETERGSKYRPGADEAQVIDPTQTGKSGYVLPQADSHYYTKAELSRLSDWGLYIARNEIPARHGYIFGNGDLSNYFGGKTWYRGTLTGDQYRSIVGIENEVERANVQLILEIEKEIGSPYRPD